MQAITVHRSPTSIRCISVGEDHRSYTARAANGRNGSKGWKVMFHDECIAHSENVRMIEFAVRTHLNAQ